MTETARPPSSGYDHGNVDLIPRMHDVLADLRERCPVGWSEHYGGFWHLTKYEDVVKASRDHTVFSTAQGITIPPTGSSMRVVPAEMDPPEHTAYRKLLMPYFTAATVESTAGDLVRDIVRNCFDGFVADGRTDLAKTVSEAVPPLVLAAYLGLDDSASHEMRELAKNFLSNAGVSLEEKQAAAKEFEAFVQREIDARLVTPTGDLLSEIVHLKVDGEQIAPEVLLGMVRLMISAGHETTVHGIASMCYRVASDPELRDQLIADPSLRPKAVQEALRMDPPVMYMARTTVAEHELRGEHLHTGDKVMLCYGAANRDPDRFADPDTFDVHRDNRTHLTFGTGRHRCLGEHLANAELTAVLDQLLSRTPDVALDPAGAVEWSGGGITRGVCRLEVVFSPS